MLKISKKYSSENFDLRPQGTSILALVIHYTDMDNFYEAVERLTLPLYKVSAHYIIHKDGTIYELVPPHLRAWHAGKSSWLDKERVNDFSIGIELDNNGKEEFSHNLMTSLINLSKQLIKEYSIQSQFILGHSDIAPDRKVDPGYFFDWNLLNQHNIGIHHNITSSPSDLIIVPYDILEVQKSLKNIGYKIDKLSGILDNQTQYAINAFNLRYYQQNKDNIINKGFLNRLQKLSLASNNI